MSETGAASTELAAALATPVVRRYFQDLLDKCREVRGESRPRSLASEDLMEHFIVTEQIRGQEALLTSFLGVRLPGEDGAAGPVVLATSGEVRNNAGPMAA